jgi:hypothetical protein
VSNAGGSAADSTIGPLSKARLLTLCALRAREAEPSGAANPGRALNRAAADFLFDLIDGGGAS